MTRTPDTDACTMHAIEQLLRDVDRQYDDLRRRGIEDPVLRARRDRLIVVLAASDVAAEATP